MEKSIIITVMVDDVELTALDKIYEQIENIFEFYESKRINITIQHEKLVPTFPR